MWYAQFIRYSTKSTLAIPVISRNWQELSNQLQDELPEWQFICFDRGK